MVSARTRQRLATTAWVAAVVGTVLNGIVVGYGAIWLQLFGSKADSEDYQVSAGGYGAAAFVLALAVPAVLAHGAPRWLAWVAGGSAALMTAFAANSWAASSLAEQETNPVNSFWDGVGGVVWAPWTWVLVALGIRAVYRFSREWLQSRR